MGSDTALQRLEAAMLLSEHIHPVSTPAASLRVFQGRLCSVTGWRDIRVRSKGQGHDGLKLGKAAVLDELFDGNTQG